MKRLILISLFASSVMFANDTIGFKDLSKAVEKLIDNQIYLEKKILKLEGENTDLKQLIENINPKFVTLEKNDNTLNTNLLKLSFQFDEFKKLNEQRVVEKIIIPKTDTIKNFIQAPKQLIVVTQMAVVRKTPEIVCGNRAKTVKYETKLNYTSKIGKWYLLEDGKYISEIVVKEYEEGKKYPMLKALKSSKKRGDC